MIDNILNHTIGNIKLNVKCNGNVSPFQQYKCVLTAIFEHFGGSS